LDYKQAQAKLGNLGGHPERVVSLAFWPVTNLVAAGYWDGVAKFDDTRARCEVAAWRAHEGAAIFGVALSPDGTTLAVGPAIRFETHEPVMTWRQHGAVQVWRAASFDETDAQIKRRAAPTMTKESR
jgi:WD40 repeat protein